MTHPLTDAICEGLANTEDRPFTDIEMDNMRAAYDLGRDAMLEQVLEWLKTNTEDYVLEDYYSTYFLIEAFLDDFKKAMRPTTTTQENNND